MKAIFSIKIASFYVFFSLLEICKQAPDAGLCSDSVTQYYYDWSLGECRTFQYTGCRGNANRFPSRDECETACRDVGLFHVPTEPGLFVMCSPAALIEM